MARRHHNSPTDNDQLGLALTGEGFQGPAEPHGLFSGAYLARHLRESSQFASRAETTAVYELACRLVGEHIPALRQRAEAFTPAMIIAAFNRDEIPADMVDLIEQLDEFRRENASLE